MKRSQMIKVIIVAIVVGLSFLYIYIYYGSGISGISALEGREKADEIAIEWNASAELVWVSAGERMNTNGDCVKWRYSYSDNNPDINLAKGLDVVVYSNGTELVEHLPHPPARYPIISWELDSDDIIPRAKTNSTVIRYLNRYSDSNLNAVALLANVAGFATWDIWWEGTGANEHPVHINVRIDATTGEVLYVETNG